MSRIDYRPASQIPNPQVGKTEPAAATVRSARSVATTRIKGKRLNDVDKAAVTRRVENLTSIQMVEPTDVDGIAAKTAEEMYGDLVRILKLVGRQPGERTDPVSDLCETMLKENIRRVERLLTSQLQHGQSQ